MWHCLFPDCLLLYIPPPPPLSLSFSFCFLNLLLTKNRKVSAFSLEAVSASASHHLSVYLRLSCVEMFWQIIPISMNKVPMTERNAATRKETVWFMNIESLWGPFLPELFPSFFLSSLLLSCFLLRAWHEISLLKNFKRYKMSHLSKCENCSSSKRSSDPQYLSTLTLIKDNLGSLENPAPSWLASWNRWVVVDLRLCKGCTEAMAQPNHVAAGQAGVHKDEGTWPRSNVIVCRAATGMLASFAFTSQLIT